MRSISPCVNCRSRILRRSWWRSSECSSWRLLRLRERRRSSAGLWRLLLLLREGPSSRRGRLLLRALSSRLCSPWRWALALWVTPNNLPIGYRGIWVEQRQSGFDDWLCCRRLLITVVVCVAALGAVGQEIVDFAVGKSKKNKIATIKPFVLGA